MGIVELVIIALISAFAVFSVLFIFMKKKKPSKKENVKEKKVEPVYKDSKKDTQTETKEDKPQAQEKPEPFKIIRKQSKVKISKKALSSGSRNPSVTKVFGKEAPKSDEIQSNEKKEENVKKTDEQVKIVPKKRVERFGVKEYEYSETNTPENFKINAPEGSPSRSFELNRRDFGSHLNISEDGNLGGVVGIGINKVVNNVENQLKKLEQKNDEMLGRAQLAFPRRLDDADDNYFDRRLRQARDMLQSGNTLQEKQDILKNIDAKTLIIAEAISNPKYKNIKSNKDDE